MGHLNPANINNKRIYKQQQHLQLILLTFFILFLTYATTTCNAYALSDDQSFHPQKTFCRFRNREYSPGDVWYPSNSATSTSSSSSFSPSSSSFGNSHCIRCSCLNTGRLNCTKEDCPANCPTSTNNNKSNTNNVQPCCKFCNQDVIMESIITGNQSETILTSTAGGINKNHNILRTGSSNSNGNNLPFANLGFDSEEDMDDDEDGLENSEFVSCLHQGKIYRDGDSFTANVSSLPIATADQCLQCQCQGGMVLCAMKPCSSFKCGTSSSSMLMSGSQSITTTQSSVIGDTCCQRCTAFKSKEEKVNTIIRKPTHSGSSSPNIGPPRLVYPTSFSGNNNNHIKIGNNNNRYNGQGGGGEILNKPTTAATTSTMTSKGGGVNFIPHQQVESSVTFRDGNNNNNNNNNGNNNTEKKENVVRAVRKHADDCISSGRFYLHGSTWHPIIGPLGPMECVTCKCNQGQIECNRLKCPHKRELSCSKPVKIEGHCCPICPNESNDQMVIPEGSTMCVNAKQDITAYKSQGFGSNDTEIIEFAFVKPLKTSRDFQVELHEWALNDGDINAFTTDYITMVQFDTLRNRQTFVLLGATNEKNVDKFTRREKKLEKRCLSRCSIRISSVERSLRLHRLISRSQCFLHERTIVLP